MTTLLQLGVYIFVIVSVRSRLISGKFFFAFLLTETKSTPINTQKKEEANID